MLGLLASLMSQATLMVCAIDLDVVRAKHLWPRSIVQPPLTDADKSYYTDAVLAGAPRPEQCVEVPTTAMKS